jgi:uncharacterized protein (DUF2062 family)
MTRRARVRDHLSRQVRRVLQLDDTPGSIARGVFLGTLIAWTPTAGLQTILCIVLGTLARANRLAAFAVTWISNPFTMLPMYYFEYVAGRVLLGLFGMYYEPWDLQRFTSLWNSITQAGMWEGSRLLWQAGLSLLVPSFCGGLVLGSACGALLAWPTWRAILRHRAALSLKDISDQSAP